MVEINGHEYPISYTIGALEEFEKLTGVDLLFSGSTFETLKEKRVFIQVGTGCEEVKELSPKEFIRVFGVCFKYYQSLFPTGDGKSEKKKNP